jgi:ribosomal protein S27AE
MIRDTTPWEVIQKDGSRTGPFTVSALLKEVQEGRISKDANVSQVGKSEVSSAKSVIAGKPDNVMHLKCGQCGGSMKKNEGTSEKWQKQIIALLVFCSAVAAALFIPFGWIFGIPVALVSMFYGAKGKKRWICQNCGYFFDRAK